MFCAFCFTLSFEFVQKTELDKWQAFVCHDTERTGCNRIGFLEFTVASISEGSKPSKYDGDLLPLVGRHVHRTRIAFHRNNVMQFDRFSCTFHVARDVQTPCSARKNKYIKIDIRSLAQLSFPILRSGRACFGYYCIVFVLPSHVFRCLLFSCFALTQRSRCANTTTRELHHERERQCVLQSLRQTIYEFFVPVTPRAALSLSLFDFRPFRCCAVSCDEHTPRLATCSLSGSRKWRIIASARIAMAKLLLISSAFNSFRVEDIGID